MDVDLGDGYLIRQATAQDHPALYDICLRTGDSGKDATHLYQDPKLLGNIYAVPYQVLAPNFAFVLDGPSGVVGYVLGVLDSASFYDRLAEQWFKPLAATLPRPGPIRALWSRDEALRDEIIHPEFQLYADLAPYPSHGHIDLLPEAQGKGFGRKLMQVMTGQLAAAGSPGIHLGVSPVNTAAQGFYRKIGFERLRARSIPRSAYIMARSLP